jgi:hypothetical protein
MCRGLALKFLFAAIAAVPASAIAAPCVTKGAEDAVVRRVSAGEHENASLFFSMTMLPKLEKWRYDTFRAGGSSCERGRFDVGSITYSLSGENGDKDAARRAISAKPGAPLAALVPVNNFLAALESAARDHAAPIEGYLLITMSGQVVMGWRLYSAIPSDAVLQADMAEALTGRMHFIFRTDLQSNVVGIGTD